jgi:hypothetical protein
VLHADLARGLRLGYPDTRFYDMLDGPVGRLRDRRFANSRTDDRSDCRTNAGAARSADAYSGTHGRAAPDPDAGSDAGPYAAAYSRPERFSNADSVSFTGTHSDNSKQLP